MPSFAELSAVLGPTAAIILFMWWNSPKPKAEKADDPMKDVTSRIDAIRDDLGDALDKLNEIYTAVEVIKDRGHR